MKLTKHTIISALALAWFTLEVFASAGDPPVSLVASHHTVTGRDTTEPETNLPPSDTTELETEIVVADIDSTDNTEPVKTAAVAAHDHEDEEVFGNEFYNEFDTTSIHSEKFDVLNFNDSVLIALSDSSLGTYVHPVKGHPTSMFAFRKYRYHLGVDVDLNTGDSVVSCFNGKVRVSQYSKSYGYVVVVRHANGLETYYAHLSKLLVKVGQEVKSGEVVGLGGNTGHSFGSHLHFETRFRGQPFDPNMIIDFQNQNVRGEKYYLSKSNFKYLSEVHKVKHYSRKKKKTWYTYYNAGGPAFATASAKAEMNRVPDPLPADAGMPAPAPKAPAPSGPVNGENKQEEKAPATSPKSTTKPPADKTASKSAPKTTPAKSSGSSTYTVKKGDTLYAIATRNGTTVAKLCALNNIKSTTTLQIGQKLRLK